MQQTVATLQSVCTTRAHHCDDCLCVCSQQIRFGLQNPQEIVQSAVLNVYERTLYKVRLQLHATVMLHFPVVMGVTVTLIAACSLVT